MAGFLYYLPRTEPTAPSLDVIVQAGLGYAFDEQPSSVGVKQNGPDGQAGFVLGDEKRMGGDYSVRYMPAEQEWKELPCGAYVGWWKAAGLPGPEDLARPTLLAGYTPEMADGRTWQVPIVRNVDNVTGESSCGLPAVLTMDSGGKLSRGQPVARYRELWEATAWCWDAMLADQDVSDQDAIETAGLVFAANYYASAFELCLMEVFSEEKSPTVILSIANNGHIYAAWKAVQEANEADPKNLERQAETPGETSSAGEVA